MIPKGVFTPYPPAKDCPPGPVWHDTQCPAAERTFPLVMDSAVKLPRFGGSIGAIAGRRDKKTRPNSPKKAATMTTIATRRITASSPESGSAVLGRGPSELRWSILERVAPLLQRQVDGAKSRRQCSRDRISLQA